MNKIGEKYYYPQGPYKAHEEETINKLTSKTNRKLNIDMYYGE